MKTVCLLASPRPGGNSATLAEHFLDKAQSLGAEVETFRLNQLHYKGCQGCMACKTKLGRCVLEDDLSPILEAVKEAQVLVIASPVYWFDINAQLKGFVDRGYSFLKPDYLTNPSPSRLEPGKRLVFILTQGAPGGDQWEVFPRYRQAFAFMGITQAELIHAGGVREPGEVRERAEVLQKAEEVAERIYSG